MRHVHLLRLGRRRPSRGHQHRRLRAARRDVPAGYHRRPAAAHRRHLPRRPELGLVVRVGGHRERPPLLRRRQARRRGRRPALQGRSPEHQRRGPARPRRHGRRGRRPAHPRALHDLHLPAHELGVAADIANPHPATEDASPYYGDVYRLSASAEGEGWQAQLPNALAAAPFGGSVDVPVYVTRDLGSDMNGTISLTATSVSDPTKTSTATCATQVQAPTVAVETLDFLGSVPPPGRPRTDAIQRRDRRARASLAPPTGSTPARSARPGQECLRQPEEGATGTSSGSPVPTRCCRQRSVPRQPAVRPAPAGRLRDRGVGGRQRREAGDSRGGARPRRRRDRRRPLQGRHAHYKTAWDKEKGGRLTARTPSEA